MSAQLSGGIQPDFVAANVVFGGKHRRALKSGRAAADRHHAKAEHRRLDLLDGHFLPAIAEGADRDHAHGLVRQQHLRLAQRRAAFDERLAERAHAPEIGGRTDDESAQRRVLELGQDGCEVILRRLRRPTGDVESAQINQLGLDTRFHGVCRIQRSLHGFRRGHAFARAARDPNNFDGPTPGSSVRATREVSGQHGSARGGEEVSTSDILLHTDSIRVFANQF